MKNRDDALLRRIVDYCNETEAAVELFGDEEVFKNNKIYQNAACMPIMQIGELCKLVSDDIKNDYSKVDWRGWCGVRDILAHQYTNLDCQKTWEIISVDLPNLKKVILDILKEVDNNSIERIKKVIEEYKISGVEPGYVYHRIIDDTGISLNAFSDEKLVEFIREKM
jgi:uncharacterized protein with HEPN domain